MLKKETTKKTLSAQNSLANVSFKNEGEIETFYLPWVDLYPGNVKGSSACWSVNNARWKFKPTARN